MPSYVLHYFDARVFAEPIRQVFRLVGVPFTDHRITYEEWPEYKKDTPMGALPFLEVDGQRLPQSQAIVRFIARQHGLAGKTPFEEAWVDAIGDQYKDYWFENIPFFKLAMGRGEGDLAKARKESGEPARDKLFGIIEKQLTESTSGFLVGDGLTWVDLQIADHVDQMLGRVPGYFDNYPKTVAHQKKIHEIPAIKKWIAERPKGVF